MNIPEVKTSYEYITELRERLEDSLKLAQEELQKSQKRYKKHYDKKAKSIHLEIGDPSTDIASDRQLQVIDAVEIEDHTPWRVVWEPTTTE